MEKKRNVIPGVEGRHLGPLAIAELDQVVVFAAVRLSVYRIWDVLPSAAVHKEVTDHISNLPAEPLSLFELAHARARRKRLRSGYASAAR